MRGSSAKRISRRAIAGAGTAVMLVACGSDGHPPPLAADLTSLSCTATVRRCKQGTAIGGGCLNNDYTDPQPVAPDPTPFCAPNSDADTDPKKTAFCTNQLCVNCIAPDCIDCVAAFGPGIIGCANTPGNGGAGVPPGGSKPPILSTSDFRVRGYEFTSGRLGASFTYEFPFDRSLGIPADISPIEDLFFVERLATPTLGGLKFTSGPPMTASIDFNGPVTSTAPYTLSTFVLPGGGVSPTSFDAFVGASFESRWINFKNGVPTPVRQIILSGQAQALSAGAYFDALPDKPAAIGTTLANEIVFVDFSLVNPGQTIRARTTVAGAPVSVTTGSDFAWAVTQSPNAMFRFIAPTLAQPMKVDLLDSEVPVAIAGGKLSAGFAASPQCAGAPPVDPYYIAVALKTPTGGELRAFPGGNLQSSGARTHTFDGEPVSMVVTVITGIEYAWVATKNPNRILQIDVSNVGAVPVEVSLDTAEPVRIVFGGTGGSVASGSGTPNCADVDESCTCSPLATQTAFLHVLVKNP